MTSPELFIAFLGAAAVFAFMPGPAMLYAAAQTLAQGRRAGLMATLGIHLGGYVHVILAALGLAALLAAVPALYLAVKLGGAAYLIWLGITMILTRKIGGDMPRLAPRSPRRAFLDSVAVEVLNPKAATFFVAFLPQFADAAAATPVWAQLLILGTIVNVMFGVADLVCVFLAGAVEGRVRRSAGAMVWARRIGGSILVALGLNLALKRA